jgi:hypothetical protein
MEGEIMRDARASRVLSAGAAAWALGAAPAAGQCELGETQMLTASDAAKSAFFGGNVAVRGDTAVIGATGAANVPGTSKGAAYVFRRTGGTWLEVGRLTTPDASTGSSFGTSVAVWGDTIVVGAPNDTRFGGPNAGSAFVFREVAPYEWIQVARLVGDGLAGDTVGASVAVDGDLCVVGAPLDDNPNGQNAGAAHIYRETDGEWHYIAKLIPDKVGGIEFGHRVGVSGGTVAVSIPNESVDGIFGAGAVHVYREVDGVWKKVAHLTPPEPATRGQFGWSLAIEGNMIVAGANFEDAGSTNSGAAYVFRGASGEWKLSARLTASDGAKNDEFGSDVGTNGTGVVVGAWLHDKPVTTGGAMYLFTETSGGWKEVAKFTASPDASPVRLGGKVAMDGRVVLGGTRLLDHSGFVDAGAAFLFEISDADGDGIPNECELVDCFADCNGDTEINIFDYLCFQGLVARGGPGADCNEDGSVDILDYLCFQGLVLAGCG